MIAIVDYGVGNLFSLTASLQKLGLPSVVTDDPETLAAADRIILPGVGAFGDAMKKLRQTGLDETLRALADTGKPLLGICLGMQLLFEVGTENGREPGLGLLPGEIRPLRELLPPGYKIPHMGWNALTKHGESRLLQNVRQGAHVYFVHSYYAAAKERDVTATAEYGAPVTATVERGCVFGCQFHPEKSGPVGLAILKAFNETEAIL